MTADTAGIRREGDRTGRVSAKGEPLRQNLTHGLMTGPPRIPILAPGELITDEIIEYVLYAKEKGCSMQGTEDPAVEYLNVL